MNCLNCGAKLTADKKVCSCCGVAVDRPTENIVVEPLEFNDAQYPQMQNDMQSRNGENAQKTIWVQIKGKISEYWIALSPYGRFSVIAITVFALLFFIAFLAARTLAGIIALISIVLVIAALLIKQNIVKTTRKWIYVVALIVAFSLILPYFGAFRVKRQSRDADLDATNDEVNVRDDDNQYESEKNTDINDKNQEDGSTEYTESLVSGDEKCEEENIENDNVGSGDQEERTEEYQIDYDSAESFEEALNDGVKVNGKVVQFVVNDYKPDSSLGINCWAGEHLNFISEEELEVRKGNIIIGRVISEPTKILGSWKILYEVLSVRGGSVENDIFQPTETDEPSNTNLSDITLTMGDEDFEGMNCTDAEQIFREMGFNSFEYQTVSTEDESVVDTICYIEITEWMFGDSDFADGDRFDADSTITFFTYVYEEPEEPSPVFYSTNDYETAQNGNSGVFSYINRTGSYDVYWIIDFDEGYVYWFTDGDGESVCDKVEIVSGTLNDRITVTWHDGDDQWSWFLHFKYENSPVTLIVTDHNGLSTEFSTTDLEDAISLRDTKTVKEY